MFYVLLVGTSLLDLKVLCLVLHANLCNLVEHLYEDFLSQPFLFVISLFLANVISHVKHRIKNKAKFYENHEKELGSRLGMFLLEVIAIQLFITKYCAVATCPSNPH